MSFVQHTGSLRTYPQIESIEYVVIVCLLPPNTVTLDLAGPFKGVKYISEMGAPLGGIPLLPVIMTKCSKEEWKCLM